jgi:cellulose binding protein with CBM2 domain
MTPRSASRRTRYLATRPCALLLGAALFACAEPAPSGDSTQVGTQGQALTSGSVTAELIITNDWGSGYTADIRMSNSGAATTSWTTTVNLGGSTVVNAWNAATSISNGQLVASNLSYNAAIPSWRSWPTPWSATAPPAPSRCPPAAPRR